MSKLTLFFIPKIYIVGLVIVALLDGREQRTLVFEDCLGVHLCRLRYVWRFNLLFIIFEALLEASQVFCSFSGSQVGFHETSTSSFFKSRGYDLSFHFGSN